MQGFVPMSGKRQSWEELRKEVKLNFFMKTLENCKIELPGKRDKIQVLAKKYVWDQYV